MRRSAIGILLLECALAGILLAPSPGNAAPQAWFVWDRTASLEPGPSNLDFTGPTTIRAAVVARGLSGEVRAHQVIVYLYSRETSFPDALRFDETGCQAGRGAIRPGPDPGDSRSLLMPGHLTLSGMVFQPGPVDAYDKLWAYVAAHSDGNPGVVTNPDSIYVLAEFDFDLGSAVAGPGGEGRCGCADQKVKVELNRIAYLDAGGNEHQVGVDYQFECVGWNDPEHDYCHGNDCFVGPPCITNPLYSSTCDAPTPGSSTSWGRLKSSYR